MALNVMVSFTELDKYDPHSITNFSWIAFRQGWNQGFCIYVHSNCVILIIWILLSDVCFIL